MIYNDTDIPETNERTLISPVIKCGPDDINPQKAMEIVPHCLGSNRKRVTVFVSKPNPANNLISLRCYIYSDNEDSKRVSNSVRDPGTVWQQVRGLIEGETDFLLLTFYILSFECLLFMFHNCCLLKAVHCKTSNFSHQIERDLAKARLFMPDICRFSPHLQFCSFLCVYVLIGPLKHEMLTEYRSGKETSCRKRKQIIFCFSFDWLK